MAALLNMGIPIDQGVVLVGHATGCDPGMVPGGWIELTFRVCAACAAKAGLRVGPVHSDTKLLYGQHPDMEEGQHR